MPTAVAFFRNLNLGQGWAPTRPQLEAAFTAAGATEVRNVRANGTVVFTHPAPVRAATEARDALLAASGYDDAVLVRRTSWLADVARRADALVLPPDVPVEVSFFDAPDLPLELPWTSPDGRLRVLLGDRRFAFTSWHDPAHGNSATRVLQELLGVSVTSRALDTVRMTLGRHTNRAP